MFERFTEEGRQVVVVAQEEARSLKHTYIGTEHILLGLLRVEEDGLSEAQPLGSLGVTLANARESVRRMVGSGEEATSGQIPFTPRAKKVLELALREALALGHNWIGPEHILLGIVRENEGVAMRVLLESDLDAETVRDHVSTLLSKLPPRPRAVATSAHQAHVPLDSAWLDGLLEVLATLGPQIRSELGREPDLGDLFLTIACARELPPGRALRDLGVDLDALWGALERVRQERADTREELSRRFTDARAERTKAIANEDFKKAAKLRDEMRDLSAQLEPWATPEDDVLREVRRRLGLADRR